MLTHGDLFSGIGGFALAAEAMGWETRYFVENNPFSASILRRRFRGVPVYGDITKIRWSKKRHAVDVLTAGFPCQPVSLAGRGLGENDPRWLWPQVARAVRILRPRYLVLENVPGLLLRGMGSVLGELSDLRYTVEWSVISAASVRAKHLRKRVWIVGYPERERCPWESRWGADEELANRHLQPEEVGDGAEGD